MLNTLSSVSIGAESIQTQTPEMNEIETGEELISFDNFNPAGPRDQLINSPRSLAACQAFGLEPTDLFVMDPEELARELNLESHSQDDKDAAYQQYIEEMQISLDQLVEKRIEIANLQAKARPKTGKKSKSVKSKRKQQEGNGTLYGRII